MEMDLSMIDELKSETSEYFGEEGFDPSKLVLLELAEINNLQVYPALNAIEVFNVDSNNTKKGRMKKRPNRSLEEEHECPKCNAIITGRTIFKKHMRKHTHEGYYECAHCGKKFERRNNLMHHIRIHTGEKPYKCDTCSRCFTQLGHLQSHMRFHTGARPHTCWMCGKSFTTPRILRLHMSVHSENSRFDPANKLFRCQTCNFIAKSKSGLVRHEYSHRSEHSSDRGNNMTKTLSQKNTKSNTIKGDRPFNCSYCSESFTDRFICNQHEETHADAFRCILCKKPFDSIVALNKHEHTHRQFRFVDSDRCLICNELFISKNELIAHVTDHVKELNPFECEFCGKRFDRGFGLRRHVITHTDLKPFTCEICNKSFNMKVNLNRHKSTHNNAKTHAVITDQGLYRCSSCPSQFTSLSSLIQHRRSHEIAKQKGSTSSYNCYLCGNVYTRPRNLVDHLKKQHNEVESYKCTECDKSFGRLSYLKDHMRVHNGLRPYSCPICSQSFTFRSGFTQHFKTHRVMAPGEVIIPDTNLHADEIFLDSSTFIGQVQQSKETLYSGEITLVEDIKPVIVDNSENSQSCNLENFKANTEFKDSNECFSSVSLSLTV